jgi:membrane protein implicated in regulation of membrane protease activity
MTNQKKYILSFTCGFLLYLIMFVALIYFNFIYYTTGFFAFVIFAFVASVLFRTLANKFAKEGDRPDLYYMIFIGSFVIPTLIHMIFFI